MDMVFLKYIFYKMLAQRYRCGKTQHVIFHIVQMLVQIIKHRFFGHFMFYFLVYKIIMAGLCFRSTSFWRMRGQLWQPLSLDKKKKNMKTTIGSSKMSQDRSENKLIYKEHVSYFFLLDQTQQKQKECYLKNQFL